MEVIGTSWKDGMAKPSSIFLKDWMGTSFLSYIFELTPKLVSFPSFSPPPISSYLVSPSLRLQVHEEILAHVFTESWTLMEKCSPLGSQNTKHNPKDV
jgi:hypothetical protein